MPETVTRVCAAHGVETRLQCSNCGDPICLRCQVRTEVGLKCLKCAALPESALPRRSRGRGLAGIGAGIVVVVVVALVAILKLTGSSTPAVKPLPPVGSWHSVPNLNEIRGGNTTAVVLTDGRVLVAGGGVGGVPLNGAELYDPTAQHWTTSGNLNQARRSNSAVLLKDGRVLTAGGIAGGTVLNSAEIWSPSSGQWTLTAPMHAARFNMVLVVLSDGRVLAAGGLDATTSASLASAEIYDPVANTWTAVSRPMTSSRTNAAAVALPDGRVLIAGGYSQTQPAVTNALSTAELFDPAAGIFSTANSMSQARQDFTLTLLANGKVLAAGGSTGNDSIGTAELFDPTSGSWSGTGAMIEPRRLQSASVLGDGTVLVAGGEFVEGGTRSSLTAAEIYDPKTGKWRSAASMSCPRSAQVQVTLKNGTALVVAGDAAFPGQQPRAQNCAEVFTR